MFGMLADYRGSSGLIRVDLNYMSTCQVQVFKSFEIYKWSISKLR